MANFDACLVAQSLTGSMDLRAFNDGVRERRPVRFGKAIGAGLLAELIDLARLEALFASETIPLAAVDLYEDGHLIRLADVQKKSGKTALAIVAERLRGGATVRVRDIDAVDRRLRELVREVRRRFAAQSQINVYLAPPAKAGFPPHFDITDVFVVQCLGAKDWRVFGDYTSRIDLPPTDTNWDPDRFRPLGSPDEMTLLAGDVLYLPRGVMHQALCRDRASLHLTISIMPMTFADLIARELQRVASTDVRFRRRVPWSIDGDAPAEAAQVADAARQCLQELAARIDVAAGIAVERLAIDADGRATETRGELTETVGDLFEPWPRAPGAAGTPSGNWHQRA